MLKEIGAVSLFFGIMLTFFGFWLSNERSHFFFDIIFGPILIYFGFQLMR